MSLPAGYVLWCLWLGLNAYHPADWTDEERDLVMQWKLERFRRRWRWPAGQDYPALFRAQAGRAALITEVREDLATALAPIPPRPYRVCPCHPARLGGVRDQPAPWRALLEIYPTLEGLPAGELAVAWLQSGTPLSETPHPRRERKSRATIIAPSPAP
jgi:hypothetical protein